MSNDVLITPASRKIEFKDSSANVDAKIETDSSGNLTITNPGGDISIGDTTADIFVGDGTNNIDIVFEQDGEIRGTSGVTVTLGASGSNVRMATDLNLNSNDITNVNDLTVAGNLTVSGTTTTVNSTNTTISDSIIELNSGLTGANSKDIGFIFERGSTGNNAGFVWDESADRFTVFTTTDTASSDTVNTSSVANFQAGSFFGNGANLSSLNASNLGSGTVPSARLSLSASDIPSLAASKITSGTFADARIPSLAASKITSGTFADARISASSITQHTDSKYLRSNATDTATGLITLGNGVIITKASSDQSTSQDSASVPDTTGSEIVKFQGGYTNGQYTTEFAKVDRSGNLPLYVRQSKGTANSFSNIARFGDHGQSNGTDVFAVFGGARVNGKVTAQDLTLSSLSAQNSEATALMINGSNVVGTRELGSNAFNSTTIPTNNNQLTNGAGYITSSNSAITNKLPLAGGTMTGDIVFGQNQANFKTNGSSTVPNFFGHRSSTNLDSRATTDEGGWMYTTFDSGSSNNPGGSHNANGLLSFNTHGGSYNHQIAMTGSDGKIYLRYRNNGSWQSWNEFYHEGHKPTYSELGTMAYSNLTGTPTIPTNNNQLTNGAGYITSSNSAITNKLPLAGGTMTGNINMNGNKLNSVELIGFQNKELTDFTGVRQMLVDANDGDSNVPSHGDYAGSYPFGIYFTGDNDGSTTTLGSGLVKVWHTGHFKKAHIDYFVGLYDSGVTTAEYDYLDGVTSNIQTQLNGKLSTSGGTMTGNLTIGSTTDSTKLVFPDKNVPDDPTAASHDRQLISMGNSGAGGLFQTTGRGGVMLASADDSVIIASGDVGRNYDPDAGGYHPDPNNEEIYLLTDGGVRFMTNLQTSASYKQFIFDNSGNATIPGNITVSGTVDGVDIASRNSVLTSTTTTANAALPKAGGTMTGDITLSGVSIKLPNSSSEGIHTSTDHRVIDSVDSTLRIGDTGKHNIIRLHAQGSDDFRVYYGATDYQIWHAGNDGSGSGLDADTLDGINSGGFLRSNANDSASGTLSLNGRVNIGNSVTRPAALNSDSVAQARIGGSDVYLYVASLSSSGGYDVAVQAARASDFASFDLNLQSNGGNLQRAGNKVWDAGNDGSGSGLDADTLDGVQGSSYLRSDASDTYTGTLTVNGSIDLSSTDTAARYIHMPRGGGITFYGDTSQHHGIFSRNQANSSADDLMISSYGAVYIDLDSNNNNTSGSDFFIGRHNQSSGSQSALFAVRSETGNIVQNSLTIMSQSSGTLTIGDIDQNDDISTVELNTMAGNGRLVVGDAEIFMYGNQNSNAEFKFTSNGILHCDNDVIAFSSTISSDRKLKENIQPIEGGLNKILKLKGVSFDWKDEKRDKNQLGFIAQDVEEVLPELVKEVETLGTEDESHKVVNYDGVIPVLVEAIKMQQEQIDKLTRRINDIEKGE